MASPAVRIAILAQADQARKELRSLSSAAGDAGKAVEGSIGKLGGVARAGAAAAGVAAGAALAAGVSQALEQGNLSAKLGVQLGLTKDEAAKVGKLAGKVYADGFGQDVAQVNDAIKGVYQNIGKGNEQWTKKITQQVLSVADVFEQDLGGTTAAVGQILRTGLAKDAEEALDALAAGLQNGADKAGDLLDTFNEYGTQFREFGLNARQATGLLVQGLKAGARDADKVADAIKEFAIRAVDGSKLTSEGFRSIGLDAQRMADAIAAGGPRSADALDLTLDRLRAIKDPAERAQAAVQLFGTQAEDLGDALFALDLTTAEQGLGRVAGAAQGAVDAMGDTPAAKIETFKRKLSQGLVGVIGELITKFEGLSSAIPASYWDGLSGSLDSAGSAAGRVRDAFADLAAAITGQNDGYGAFLQGLRILQGAVDAASLVIGNLAFQLHTASAAAYSAKAGWLFLTGDVDGARDALDRAKQSTGQATAALEGQRLGVDKLRQNWQQGGLDIQRHQEGIAAKAAITAKSTGDQHDRAAKLAQGSYAVAAGSIGVSQGQIGASGSSAVVSRSHAVAASQTSGSWSHVPGAIKGYFARATLAGAGVSVMASFLSGARDVWNNQVAPWLAARAAQIKQLKGPPAKDRRLLIGAGRLVMAGFRDGLEREYGAVRASLEGFTRALPGDSATIGGLDLPAGRGGSPVGAQSAPVTIGQVTVNLAGSLDLSSPADRKAAAEAMVREIQEALVAYEGGRR